jgi:RecG-like helicase
LGRVHAVSIRPVGESSILACTITDDSGELTAVFYGRTYIPEIKPGNNLRLRGQLTDSNSGPVMINPAYELTDPAP